MILRKIRTFLRRVKGLLSYIYRNKIPIRREIDKLRVMKSHDSAFIIATGPSVKRQDLSQLQGFDCFTVSNAFLHEKIVEISPIAHAFAGIHPPMEWQNSVKWLAEADAKLPERTVIYTPISNERYVEAAKFGSDRHVIFIYQDTWAKYLWPGIFRFIFPPPVTGPQIFLPLLMELGYKKIYLIGCDHTVLRNYGGDIENFYKSDEDLRVNATNKNVWKDVRQELRAEIDVFDQYEYYEKKSKQFNVEIINVSDDSWLKNFPFAKYEKIIAFERGKLTHSQSACDED